MEFEEQNEDIEFSQCGEIINLIVDSNVQTNYPKDDLIEWMKESEKMRREMLYMDELEGTLTSVYLDPKDGDVYGTIKVPMCNLGTSDVGSTVNLMVIHK